MTLSVVTAATKYPKCYSQHNIEQHKKLLKGCDLQPEYDGSDITSTSKAGLIESFSNYGQRVERWLDRKCKEEDMSDDCCNDKSSSCSTNSNPVSDNSSTQGACTNDADTCDKDPCCKKDN